LLSPSPNRNIPTCWRSKPRHRKHPCSATLALPPSVFGQACPLHSLVWRIIAPNPNQMREIMSLSLSSVTSVVPYNIYINSTYDQKTKNLLISLTTRPPQLSRTAPHSRLGNSMQDVSPFSYSRSEFYPNKRICPKERRYVLFSDVLRLFSFNKLKKPLKRSAQTFPPCSTPFRLGTPMQGVSLFSHNCY